MNTNECLDQPHRKKERVVSFSQEIAIYGSPVIENATTFTPYRKIKKSPNFSRIKNDLLAYISDEKYEAANALLDQYTEEEITNFYKQKGSILFSWAIIDARNSRALSFLVQTVPRPIILGILSDRDFSILYGFLAGHKTMEKNRWFSPAEKALATEKISVILTIDDITLRQFVDAHMIDSIKTAMAGRASLDRPMC